MKIGQGPLSKSFGILYSISFIVFLTYLFDLFYESRLSAVFYGSQLGIVVLCAFILVKIYFYSGIYAALMEIVSGEEYFLTFGGIINNAKKYWKALLLISCLPVLAHFSLHITIPDSNVIPLGMLTSLFTVIILMLAAYFIFCDKYLQRFKPFKRKIVITTEQTLAIFAFFLINVSIFYLRENVFPQKAVFVQVSMLVEHYVHFLQFLYIASLLLLSYPDVEKKCTPEKELFLICPSYGGILYSIASFLKKDYPPIFVVLKALTPPNYKTREFIRMNWSSRYLRPNKLVGITCYTSNCYEAYKIAKDFKKCGSKVVMGGAHVTYLPEEALDYCDSVVIGEVEGVWKDVIRDYENNCLKKVYQGGTMTENYHQDVHRELLQSPPHVVRSFMETVRGCKFLCDFCTIPGLSGGKTRTKPVHEVVELINKFKPRYKSFTFIDNNIYNDPAYAKDLFKALKPLNIRWSSQCTIDIAKNKEALKLARESGCQWLLIGYEIPEGSEEKGTGGKFSMAAKYKQFTKEIKKAGIKIRANFIFGFESDNLSSLFRLWKFCLGIRPALSILYFLTPLPGSKLYRDMLNQDRLTNLNWRQYHGGTLLIQHKKLNNFLLSRLYFIIYPLFLFTTSKVGLMFVLIFLQLLILIKITS